MSELSKQKYNEEDIIPPLSLDQLLYGRSNSGPGFFYTKEGTLVSIFSISGIEKLSGESHTDRLRFLLDDQTSGSNYGDRCDVIKIFHQGFAGELDRFTSNLGDGSIANHIFQSLVSHQKLAYQRSDGFLAQIPEAKLDSLDLKSTKQGMCPLDQVMLLAFHWTPKRSMLGNVAKLIPSKLSSHTPGLPFSTSEIETFTHQSQNVMKALTECDLYISELDGQTLLGILRLHHQSGMPNYEEGSLIADVSKASGNNIPPVCVSKLYGDPNTDSIINKSDSWHSRENFQSLEREFEGGTHPAILMNNRDGEAVNIDLFGCDCRTANSLIVDNESDQATPFFPKMLAMMQAKYKPKSWILSCSKKYQTACTLMDGQYYEIGGGADKDTSFCVNPIYVSPGVNGVREKPDADNLANMASIISLMHQLTLSDRIQNDQNLYGHIYRGLRDYFQQWSESGLPYSEPKFAEFVKVLNDRFEKDPAAALYRNRLDPFYGDGEHAQMFDGPTSVSFENDFTVMDFEALSDSPALPVLILSLLRHIDDHTSIHLPNSTYKVCVIDDLLEHFDSRVNASFLYGFMRYGRMYRRSTILKTSSFAAFENLSAACAEGYMANDSVLIENIDHLFVSNTDSNCLAKISNIFELSESEYKSMVTLDTVDRIYDEVYYRYRRSTGLYRSGVLRSWHTPVSRWFCAHGEDESALLRDRFIKLRAHSTCTHDAAIKTITSLAAEYPFLFEGRS